MKKQLPADVAFIGDKGFIESMSNFRKTIIPITPLLGAISYRIMEYNGNRRVIYVEHETCNAARNSQITEEGCCRACGEDLGISLTKCVTMIKMKGMGK